MATALVTYELPWTELVLASTHFYADKEDLESYILQWHPAGATLFILLKDKLEIDLRLEREIVNIKYQDPKAIAGITKTALISMTMLPSRPLPWATGADFEPRWDDSNQITMKIKLASGADGKTYNQLVDWMVRNVNSGEAKMLTVDEALEYWKQLHSIDISSDDEGDEQDLQNSLDKELWKGEFVIIQARDVERLQPGEWANDEIMNYGISVISKQARSYVTDKSFHVWSTFFYPKLAKCGGPKAMKGLSKWGRKQGVEDLFTYDYVLVPVHRPQRCPHWYLVIIDMPANALKSNSPQSNVPVMGGIYVLDSLTSGHPAGVVDKIEDYITMEAQTVKGRKVNLDNYPIFDVKVPQQLNGSDCGYYALHFAKAFLEDPEKYRGIIWSETGTHLKRNWGEPSKMRASLATQLADDIKAYQDSRKAGELEKEARKEGVVGEDDQAMDQ